VRGLADVVRLPEGGKERRGLIPLDRNERLAPLPDVFLDELRAGLDSVLLTEYPVLDGLYADLSAWLGVPRESLLLTTGSDAAFRAAFQAYVEPGDGVVLLEPSYAMYRVYARLFRADVRPVEFGPGHALEPESLLERIGPGVKLVLIANPNQPTGTLIEPEVLRVAVEQGAEHGALVMIDEAYFPFSGVTMIDRLGEHSNLVITRTFSKAHGLAGLRVGVLAASEEVASTLFKVRSVYDVNAVAALAARTALAHPEIADDYVREVDAGRDVLVERARALGLEPLPSPTNFLQIRVSESVEPTALIDALRDRGYLVRGPFNHPSLAGCVRVTLGPPELMARFAEALEQALEATRGR